MKLFVDPAGGLRPPDPPPGGLRPLGPPEERLGADYGSGGYLGWILGGILGAFKMAEIHEKRCFTVFGFLPPYIGVSSSLTYVKR